MSTSPQLSLAVSTPIIDSLSGLDHDVVRWPLGLMRHPFGRMYSQDDFAPRHLSVMPSLTEANPSSIGQQAMRTMWPVAERDLERMGVKDRCTLRVLSYGGYKAILALYISPGDAPDTDLVDSLKAWGDSFLQNKLCNDGRFFIFRVFVTGWDGALLQEPSQPSWTVHRADSQSRLLTPREKRKREKRERDEKRGREQAEVTRLIAAGDYDQALLLYRDVTHIGHRRVTRSQGRLLSAQENEERVLPMRI